MGLCKWRNRAALGEIGVAKFIYLSLVEPLIVLKLCINVLCMLCTLCISWNDYTLVFRDPPLSVIGIFICQKREMKGIGRFPSDLLSKAAPEYDSIYNNLVDDISRHIFCKKLDADSAPLS